jgi:hypothetical protein
MEVEELNRYVIERDMPGVGKLSPTELGDGSRSSNAALAQLKGIQWVQSFVTADRIFCIYLAENEDVIREHARISGFPATRIHKVHSVIDPTTEKQCSAYSVAA